MRVLPIVFLMLLPSAGGCAAGYVAPGRAADMNVFLEPDLERAYARRAASPLPATPRCTLIWVASLGLGV